MRQDPIRTHLAMIGAASAAITICTCIHAECPIRVRSVERLSHQLWAGRYSLDRHEAGKQEHVHANALVGTSRLRDVLQGGKEVGGVNV